MTGQINLPGYGLIVTETGCEVQELPSLTRTVYVPGANLS